MGQHEEVDEVAENDGEPKAEGHHHGGEIIHKIEEAWHHLEDLTGGRAHIEVAGEDGLSNLEGIEHHQDAEHH